MTSPPYWGLRDYGVKGQIGLERHPQEYIDNIVAIFHEVKRVLRPHGSLYLSLGDTYCSTKGSCFNAGGGNLSLRQPAFKTLVRDQNPNRMLKSDGGWLQPKQLLLIPARIAMALQHDGWILRNDVIWYKPNGLPNSVKDRLTNKYEHVFHFVKSRRYFYDLDSIRIPHKRGTRQSEIDYKRMMAGRQEFVGKWTRAGVQKAFVAGHHLGRNPGDVYRLKTAVHGFKGQHSGRNPPEPNEPHAFHNLGKNPGDVLKVTKHEMALGRLSNDSLHVKAYHPAGKNPGDFWRITTKPFPRAHFAVYPEDLCVQPILSSCPERVCRACETPPWPAPTQRVSTSDADWRAISRRRDMPLRRRVAHDPGGRTGLIVRHIRDTAMRSWTTCDCDAGFDPGIVLDPFAGAGTTLLVAHQLGRRWVGCELNCEYVRIARKRITSVKS